MNIHEAIYTSVKGKATAKGIATANESDKQETEEDDEAVATGELSNSSTQST